MMEMIPRNTYKDISDQEFEAKILNSTNTLHIVVFTTSWLGGGQILDNYMNSFATQYTDNTAFHRLDIDKSDKYIKRYGINQLPMTLFFQDGAIVDSFQGLIAKRKIQARIEALLNA